MAVAETNENHKDENLITRYYRNDYVQCRQMIETICKNSDFDLININDDFQEILIETPGFVVNIKIICVTPLETAIDFIITSESFFKRPSSHVIQWYEALDKSLQFIGKGLHKHVER